jgi:hypothetical protein
MVITMHRAGQIIARHAKSMRERPSRVIAALRDVGANDTSGGGGGAGGGEECDVESAASTRTSTRPAHHDRELRALIKRLNGNVALRGRAAEQSCSRDAKVAAAAQRLEAMGEPDALVDEEGTVVSRGGRLVPPPPEPSEYDKLMRTLLELRDELRSEVREASCRRAGGCDGGAVLGGGGALGGGAAPAAQPARSDQEHEGAMPMGGLDAIIRVVIREELKALGPMLKAARRPLAAGTKSGSAKSAPRERRQPAGEERPPGDAASQMAQQGERRGETAPAPAATPVPAPRTGNDAGLFEA